MIWLLILNYSKRYLIIQSLEAGQTLHLMCKSDKSWEFFRWKNTNSNYRHVGARDCVMEWKRAKVKT